MQTQKSLNRISLDVTNDRSTKIQRKVKAQCEPLDVRRETAFLDRAEGGEHYLPLLFAKRSGTELDWPQQGKQSQSVENSNTITYLGNALWRTVHKPMCMISKLGSQIMECIGF
jgi:hypothetical protein